LLLRSIKAASIMSARADICCSPNMILINAKTRSHAAEFGEMANATRAARAHAGNDLPLVPQQRRHTLMFRPWQAAAKGWALEVLGQQLMAGCRSSVSEVCRTSP
jgi:hypothetical protein